MLGHILNLKRAQTSALERYQGYCIDPLEVVGTRICPKA